MMLDSFMGDFIVYPIIDFAVLHARQNGAFVFGKK